MKKVLIISPHFPPVNAADVQRLRHSLPYFKKYGWTPEVITVDLDYVESYSNDALLNETVPDDVKIHYVKAWDAKKTRKYGLGSLSMRSFFFFKELGNQLLKTGDYDLVYFTTTGFHVMALGRYWKDKFGIPFILDIQDPWRNDFYLSRPKNQRPPKFWMSYNIDKYLELYTMKKVDGVISVSQGYNDTFLQRYPYLKPEQFTVIPFGYSEIDFEVMRSNVKASQVKMHDDKINIVYVGRGGHDMKLACTCFFTALKNIAANIDTSKLHCWFIGTSYATKGKGSMTIKPIADSIGVGAMVTEITDRVPFFETLYLLDNADAFFVPGSTDMHYTASKIYQYVLSEKPMLTVFYQGSSIINILKKAGVGTVVTFDEKLEYTDAMVKQCEGFLLRLLQGESNAVNYNRANFAEYSADTMTKKQVDFFNKIIAAKG